jgi:hypothetical protein
MSPSPSRVKSAEDYPRHQVDLMVRTVLSQWTNPIRELRGIACPWKKTLEALVLIDRMSRFVELSPHLSTGVKPSDVNYGDSEIKSGRKLVESIVQRRLVTGDSQSDKAKSPEEEVTTFTPGVFVMLSRILQLKGR